MIDGNGVATYWFFGGRPMTTSTEIEHLSVEERKALGKQLRASAAPTSHAGWKPAADRPDPVALLEEQAAT
jgi:hypothetical protein